MLKDAASLVEGVERFRGEALPRHRLFRKGPIMRKFRLLFVSVLLALPVLGAGAAPAHACTSEITPDGCEVVNRVCRKFFGADCVK